MYFPLNYISWLTDFVFFQGVLFGTMLMFLHSKNKRPTFFLGVFVLVISIELLFNLYHDNYALATNINKQFISVSFYGIVFPYFYLYVQRVSALKSKRLSYWVLLPSVIELIIVLALYFVPFKLNNEILLNLKYSSFEFYYILFAFVYSMYVVLLIFKWLYSYSRKLGNQYHITNDDGFFWIHCFLYLSVGLYVIKFINFITPNNYLETIIVLANLGLVYWVTYKGILQRNGVVSDSQNTDHQELMTKQQAIDLLRVVKKHIEDSRCYVNDKLTIVDLAEAIHIHPKRISFAINSIKGIHFNRYINFFRVGYAKVLLKSKSMQKLSIEGIGMQAGFHSKSTFYSAFKRFEGMTPAKYKTLS